MQFNIFCDVIDNYGDAGVCLRLCRDLCSKGHKTVLYSNNVETVKKIMSDTDSCNSCLTIKSWPKNITDIDIEGIVIQAFSVRLPYFLNSIISKKKLTVINLEYLTAEKFAEDCHKLPSYADGFESFYFFPGFTEKTGGVVIEDYFIQNKKSISAEQGCINLFCYENIHIDGLIKLLKNSNNHYTLNVFEGKPTVILNKYLNSSLKIGDIYSLNNLDIKVIPMTDQIEFDKLLLKSEINLVRGEDSIVRAMLCGNPFLWNIYSQKKDAHKDKINALFDLMKKKCTDKESVETLRLLTLSYNNFTDYIYLFNLDSFINKWKKLSLEWSDNLIKNKSLTNNLLEFIKSKNVVKD